MTRLATRLVRPLRDAWERFRGSFRGQIVGSTVLLVAAVMVVLIGGSQAVLELTARREIDRALAERADTAIALLADDSDPQDASLEPGTRVYDRQGRGVAGTIERAVRAKADQLARTALADRQVHVTDGPADVHLRAQPYAGGAIVVTQDAEPYERSEIYAFVAMCVLGVTVICLAGGVAWRVSRKALAPVQVMAERAADWSEHDLGHRFALGPPTNELAALGETLDHLLDRVAAAIRSEQRLTSELAHELRTPLTAVRGAAEVALLRGDGDPDLREDLVAIADGAKRMAEVVTTLLTLARTPATVRASVRSAPADIVDAVTGLVPERLWLETCIDTVPDVGAPADLAVRALAPLVENAVEFAATRITLSVRRAADGVEIGVADDGPGVDPGVVDRIFDPGISAAGSTGLGLGISRRVAQSLGGDVTLADGEFVLRLPRA